MVCHSHARKLTQTHEVAQQPSLVRLLAQTAQLCDSLGMHTTTNLLTSEQVAAKVGTTASTINRWAKSGKLPAATKLPGRTGNNLFAVADVLALLQGGDLND